MHPAATSLGRPTTGGSTNVGADSTASRTFYSPEEFHHALGGAIGRSSIYQLVRANRIRHVRVGRKILIPVSEVHDFPNRETGRTN